MAEETRRDARSTSQESLIYGEGRWVSLRIHLIFLALGAKTAHLFGICINRIRENPRWGLTGTANAVEGQKELLILSS